MSVRFFYVDESYNDDLFCISAIAIRHSHWQECFTAIKNHRMQLKHDFGIPLSREIHAHQFVSGHGKLGAATIGKWQRSRILLGLLQLVARLPEVMVFNVCLPTKGCLDPQLKAWERLTNRIERTMVEFENRESKLRGKWLQTMRSNMPDDDFNQVEVRLTKSYRPRAVIIADEGNELQITRTLRRMHVYNRIPSQFGTWPDGSTTKNIVTQRIIEDPFFKNSHASYFIQLADCVAFSLLKREATPTPHVKKYHLNKMFEDALASACFREASPRDPLGIVRS